METIPAFSGWASSASAPSSVPAGQMYLQKAGTGDQRRPKYSGSAAAKTSRMAYLRWERARDQRPFFTLGEGILCSSSCTSPIGQSQPQTTRPSTSPKSSRMPST